MSGEVLLAGASFLTALGGTLAAWAAVTRARKEVSVEKDVEVASMRDERDAARMESEEQARKLHHYRIEYPENGT